VFARDCSKALRFAVEREYVVNLLLAVREFGLVGELETEHAFLVKHVPAIAPEAYLHVILKPVSEALLIRAKINLDLPSSVLDFLRVQNGAILFSGALNIFGLCDSTLLERDRRYFVVPYDLHTANQDWPPPDGRRFLAIASYGFDGSTVCIDRVDQQLYLFRRGTSNLEGTHTIKWRSVEAWLANEVKRLSTLFGVDGSCMFSESLTVPSSVAS
jgi:hypothetical protein